MKKGDIFEIETRKGKGYLQFVKEPENKTQLEKVRIFYKLYKERPETIESITYGEYFFLEFPFKAALKKKIIDFIGNISLSKEIIYPNYFRTENVFGKGWRIIDSKGGQKVVEELTDEEIKMSPWGTWNAILLKENLENGFRLENWL